MRTQLCNNINVFRGLEGEEVANTPLGILSFTYFTLVMIIMIVPPVGTFFRSKRRESYIPPRYDIGEIRQKEVCVCSAR